MSKIDVILMTKPTMDHHCNMAQIVHRTVKINICRRRGCISQCICCGWGDTDETNIESMRKLHEQIKDISEDKSV